MKSTSEKAKYNVEVTISGSGSEVVMTLISKANYSAWDEFRNRPGNRYNSKSEL